MHLKEKSGCAGDKVLRGNCGVILHIGCPTLRRQWKFLYVSVDIIIIKSIRQFNALNSRQNRVQQITELFLLLYSYCAARSPQQRPPKEFLARLVKQLAYLLENPHSLLTSWSQEYNHRYHPAQSLLSVLHSVLTAADLMQMLFLKVITSMHNPLSKVYPSSIFMTEYCWWS